MRGGNGMFTLAERAVKAARELRSIAHHHNLMRNSSINKTLLDTLNTPIIHITWRNTIRTGKRIVNSSCSNTLD